MRLKETNYKKPVLNKETVARLNSDEMAGLKGGNATSLIFTMCACMTRFCTDTCP